MILTAASVTGYQGGRNHGGEQQQYGGGNQNYGGGNQEYGGGNQNYGGGNQNYGGGNQNYGGGNQNYGGGNQNYGGHNGGNGGNGGNYNHDDDDDLKGAAHAASNDDGESSNFFSEILNKIGANKSSIANSDYDEDGAFLDVILFSFFLVFFAFFSLVFTSCSLLTHCLHPPDHSRQTEPPAVLWRRRQQQPAGLGRQHGHCGGHAGAQDVPG